MLGNLLEKFGWEQNYSDGASQASTEQDFDAHYESGLNLVDRGLYTEAVEEFKQAIKKNATSAQAHRDLANAYKNLGRVDKAIRAYQDALRIQPSFETYNELGMAYDSKGKVVEAIKMYMKALRLKPESIDIRNNLGMAYYNVGSYAEATKAFHQALQIKKDSGQAHYGLALVHIDQRLKEPALEEHQVLKNLGEVEIAAQLLDEINRQFD
jgi:Flp pilus assembly protein TadD